MWGLGGWKGWGCLKGLQKGSGMLIMKIFDFMLVLSNPTDGDDKKVNITTHEDD